jgi:quercetin dioxygenase-like cupin family protein
MIMATLQRKNVGSPDETRAFPKGSSDIVRLGEVSMARIVLQPGWRWSEHVQPLVGGESCQAPHLGHLISGRIGVRMDDGREMEFEPGDVYEIPPGHDGWVIGDEPAVGIEVTGAEVFAKAR